MSNNIGEVRGVLIRDYRINTLLNNIDNYININNYKSEEEIDWITKYNSYRIETRKNILVDIFKSQPIAIREAIKNNKSITIPILGTFKIKESRRDYLTKRNELAKEAGYDNYEDVPFDERDKFKNHATEYTKQRMIERSKIKELAKDKIYTTINKIRIVDKSIVCNSKNK